MPASTGKELFTERLHLRCPTDADASAIITIAGDREVARRLGRVPHPYTQEDFRFFMERVVPNEPTWAIVLKRATEVVGVIGLVPHPESRSAELGYSVERFHWRQGLATEAAQAIVRMIVEVDAYDRLTSRFYADTRRQVESWKSSVLCRLVSQLTSVSPIGGRSRRSKSNSQSEADAALPAE